MCVPNSSKERSERGSDPSRAPGTGQRALPSARGKVGMAGNMGARSWELSGSPPSVPALFTASFSSCRFDWGSNTPTLVFATQNRDGFNTAVPAFQATGHTGTKH